MDWVSEIVDPERRLALAYAPRERREALTALWVLDERLGAIVAATNEAMLGQIRLAWWRDALQALAEGAPAGEPLLGQLEQVVRHHRLAPSELARLPEGWTMLLNGLPLEHAALITHANERGSVLFRLSAAVLGADHPGVCNAGAAWALVDVAARISDRQSAASARLIAIEHLKSPKRHPWPKPLRPLAVLAALAHRDAYAAVSRRQGSPLRLAVALWAGMTGR